jgi:hypothetical protein
MLRPHLAQLNFSLSANATYDPSILGENSPVREVRSIELFCRGCSIPKCFGPLAGRRPGDATQNFAKVGTSKRNEVFSGGQSGGC